MSGQASCYAELHCPYCGSGLEWIKQGPEAAGFGILKCGCSRHPVVDGVPILQHKDGLDKVVRLIEAGDHQESLLATLNAFRITWARKNRWYQLRYRRNCARLVSDENCSFEEAVDLVRRPQVFADYLLHRWANPSFLAALGPLMLFGEPARQRRVLDLACGAGHSSFVMRRLFPSLSVASVDHDFVSLYLAKRFLVPGGTFYCLDAEVPSPFPDSYFDAVFCLDAFHYFRSKCAIRDELKRVVSNDGIWVLAHLHNALQTNITPGVPLTPEHYQELFKFVECRLFDEGTIIRGLERDDQMDLRVRHPAGQLRNAGALTLIGGSQDLWKVHGRFADRLCGAGTGLAVNPIFAPGAGRAADELVLRWPNEVMSMECASAEGILPSSCTLSKARLQELLEDRNRSQLEELVRRFVLVPLPERYLRQSVV